jgi:DNA-directed RNA polymerase subunit F
MRNLPLLLAAVAVLALVGLAAADEPKPMRPVAMPSLRLLHQKAVQEELKLSEEQLKKLSDATQKFKEEREAAIDKGEKPDLTKLVASTDKAVAEFLKAEQLKRLKQIQLQVGGPRVFANAALAKEMKITEEQKKKLTDLQEETAAAAKKIFEKDADSREEARKKMTELNNKVREKIIDVMDGEQKEKWKEKVGEPFNGVLPFGPPMDPPAVKPDQP